ncbi:hypothetical protein OG562_22180 [Streptomyces sp. NBC_01275]|uniref:hypothetical protein n=1 Tax=Streptomyces sp. NBC_01275 TaxID=2903807 RepID=UPI002252C2CB|nr:hypothetical protein [Streptomyces sp. NBC_01275]MCX4763621.1 hypothetical protein [Streptomyces sp. NBC_01275]
MRTRSSGPRDVDGTPETVPATVPATVPETVPGTVPESWEVPPLRDGLAEVRVIAADPEVAQQVALVLRQVFHCDEPRSYPTGANGGGTLLHLTVDTGRAADADAADGTSVPSPWLDSSRSQARRAHTDEPG